jgi:hypothetical protein
MDLRDFLAGLQQGCDFLETEGYILRKVDSSINRNYWYEKHTETEGYRIAFTWTQYGSEFHVNGLHAQKRFNEIEQQIQRVMGGDLADYYTIYKLGEADLIPENLAYKSTENNIDFVLKNETDILLFADFVKEFYTRTVKDFYTHYSKLEVVNSLLQELLDTKQIQSLLTSIDNTTIIRFYLIALMTVNTSIINFFKFTYMPYLENNAGNEIKKLEKERIEQINFNLNINF